MMAKKIVNDPSRVVPELLEGLLLASGGQIIQVGPVGAIAKAAIPDGKVGLLIGGGSGHEPLFHGFIGDAMADGAACGAIFTSPPPDVILAVTRAVNRGKGVMYLYGNYAGDIMNFDIAAELADEEGIRVRTVRIRDDVASAPPDRQELRRGIAGDIVVIKIAGAAASVLDDLDEVVRVTEKARDATRSIGVAVAAGSIPETGERTFELGDDEIEIGMGLHGEPGVRRQKMAPANEVVDLMAAQVLSDLPFVAGDEIVLLVNNLGSTTMMELLIASRRLFAILAERGIKVHHTAVGTFATCQEMAGFSFTLMRLDDELRLYYDMPAESLGFTRK
jgi:phosphoenolpyruvate---glycerone phosphotransferase subunit DhaK